MGDYSIKARFETGVPRDQVLKWLMSIDGISGWWSDRVWGSAGSVGDEFHVEFPTTDVVFDLVVEDASDGLVVWHVPESPPWWQGTSIRFEVEESEEGSSLLFTHGEFDSEDPIVAVITPAWVGFVNRLMEVARSGERNPAIVN